MRIGDWRSDVCSSDLHVGSTLASRLLAETADILPLREPMLLRTLAQVAERIDRPESVWSPDLYRRRLAQALEIGRAACREKSVSVSGDSGGRLIMKKKNKRN